MAGPGSVGAMPQSSPQSPRGRESPARVVEALLVGGAGGAIGVGTGLALGSWLSMGWIPYATGSVAAANGLFGGARGIYAWHSPGGVAAFVLDSSWALLSTALGVLVNAYNTLRPGTRYAPEFSERENRHVFAGGFALKRGFANTQGPVVSNAGLGRDEPLWRRRDLIERHEGLHVWQQRWFGPIHPLVYALWGVFGLFAGGLYGIASRERRRRGVRIGELVETAAYYDNPFEYWAYRNDGRWDRCGAQPVLKWGTFSWPDEDDR